MELSTLRLRCRLEIEFVTAVEVNSIEDIVEQLISSGTMPQAKDEEADKVILEYAAHRIRSYKPVRRVTPPQGDGKLLFQNWATASETQIGISYRVQPFRSITSTWAKSSSALSRERCRNVCQGRYWSTACNSSANCLAGKVTRARLLSPIFDFGLFY